MKQYNKYNYSKKKKCKNCSKLIGNLSTYCISCQGKGYNGKNNPNFKDGRCSKIYYCKEKGCNNKICYQTWKCGSGLCMTHSRQKPHNRCIDCGNVIHHQAKRCKKCSYKLHGKKVSGRLGGMYGKIAKHGKGQYYKQNYMRSSYEIAFAQYCIINHIKYRYEPKAFEIIYKYNGIKKEGTYRPDFYLLEYNKYIEIKGYWRDDAKVKFNAFKRQYSNIKLDLLMKPELKELGIKI